MSTDLETTKRTRTSVAKPFGVILYNDDVHTIDQVVLQIQKATGKSESEAYQVTLEAHLKGKSLAFRGSLSDCQRVSGVLRSIRLQVEIDEA